MAKTVTSPLIQSTNNIVALNIRGKNSIKKMQSEYTSFTSFLKRETNELKRIKLPEKRKIKELSNLNAGQLFGTPGNLLGGLVSGAFDAAGFLSSVFPDRGPKANPKPQKIPSQGGKLKFSGPKAFGIANTVFAGLDFATGLQEGESVGKAAAGAGGSLAGSLLGGAIGQTLIPIPGVGFVLGSMAGGFLGGYAADRVYEGVSGTGVEEKQKEQLQAEVESKKSLVSGSSTDSALDRFSDAVNLFGTLITSITKSGDSDIGAGTETDMVSAEEVDDQTGITGEYPGFDNVERVLPFVTGQVSTYPGAQFGASRKGGRIHAGQDISGQKEGDPVLATMAGTVIEVGNGYRWQRGGGSSQTIGIQHKDGSKSRYVHVMANVSQGQEVKTGQQIGTISPADIASSPDFPHLHFELYAPGKSGAMDPRPYLNTAPKTPAVAPIRGAQASVGPSPQTMKFGANDIESAPIVTVGDSIAQGVKGNGPGRAQQSANPKQVLDFLKSTNLGGKVVRLSSGISNNTSDLATVREQIKYAQSQGAKGVQLMGTSFDRADLAKMNPLLQALANEFPGFVQFAGGFKSTDLIHPNYSQYSQTLNELLKGGSGGLGVDPSMIDMRTNMSNAARYYTEYNKPGSTIIMPIMNQQQSRTSSTPTVTSAGGGGKSGSSQTIIMGDSVNNLMKTILLTSLSQT